MSFVNQVLSEETYTKESVSHQKNPYLDVVAPNSFTKKRSKVMYGLVLLGSLSVIVFGQIIMNIALSSAAYELDALMQQEVMLQRQKQVLAQEINSLSSPQNLATQAHNLGMVSNNNLTYIRLSDGAVLGVPITGSVTSPPVFEGSESLVPNAQLQQNQNPPSSVGPLAPVAPPNDPGEVQPPQNAGPNIPAPVTR